MAQKIDLPVPLKVRLEASPFKTDVDVFADRVASILQDNKTPFFEAYTDHGIEHVQRVLDTCVKLIPQDVLDDHDLLTGKDAAALICAVLLHDLAMHLRKAGFAELVAVESRWSPVPWFTDRQGDRSADVPWHELWEAYQREARHFGRSQLDRILGPDNAGPPPVVHAEVVEPDSLGDADALLIGEFLRRHHARLAHEMALHGFPGLNADELKLPPGLARAAGVVARSHGEPLRLLGTYLASKYEQNLSPEGARLHYLMGLLRVADYLQLDADRAPSVLLRLKDPQSRQSIQEWNNHHAVADVIWTNGEDVIRVDVGSEHRLRTHLALQTLLDGLQQELDVTTAVLNEVYSGTPVAALRLKKRRVVSNIDSGGLHEDLPYVAERAALRSDEDLFRLVIGDLYGDQPAVAGRELIQNAVDAVRERRRLEILRGKPFELDLLRQQSADVVVTVEQCEGRRWELRVEDRGVGMNSRTVIDYLLRAGASFGPTPAEREGLDPLDLVRTMKTGRFGVGVFAGFLLGPEVGVTTRHVDAQRGLRFTARIDEDLVELEWCDSARVGTAITVPFHASSDAAPNLLLMSISEMYCLADPEVRYELVPIGGRRADRPQARRVPSPGTALTGRWRAIEAPGFDRIYWHGERTTGGLVHNGIAVRDLVNRIGAGLRVSQWRNPDVRDVVLRPELVVFDSRNTLRLALHRYWMTDPLLPFEEELLRSMGADIVAWSLERGQRRYPLGANGGLQPVVCADGTFFPLLADLVPEYTGGRLLVAWVRPSSDRSTVDPGAILERWSEIDGDPRAAFVSIPYRQYVTANAESAASWWATRLHAVPVATVHGIWGDDLRSGGPGRGRGVGGSWDVVAAENGVRASVLVSRTADADDERRLVDLIDGVARATQGGIATFTLFDFRSQQEPRTRTGLSAPWHDVLRGGLPRDRKRRRALAGQVFAAHPELEALAETWRE